jgi:hypothetical protein
MKVWRGWAARECKVQKHTSQITMQHSLWQGLWRGYFVGQTLEHKFIYLTASRIGRLMGLGKWVLLLQIKTRLGDQSRRRGWEGYPNSRRWCGRHHPIQALPPPTSATEKDTLKRKGYGYGQRRERNEAESRERGTYYISKERRMWRSQQLLKLKEQRYRTEWSAWIRSNIYTKILARLTFLIR